jgi:2-polyprenyl-6-methoxyphenol hydroxylase-like FAD-dependent oxidoreductase
LVQRLFLPQTVIRIRRSKLLKVAIIGAGVVGTAIGYLLARVSYPVTGVAGRTPESAGCPRALMPLIKGTVNNIERLGIVSLFDKYQERVRNYA